MKTPRTIKIINLLSDAIKAFLRNEQLGLKGSLDQLDELGGIYIKFLQMIVLSSSGQQQKNFTELLKVYEDSKPDEIDIRVHLKSIAMPGMDKIAELEIKPFATGSFGQVYKAKLVSGEIVIIKVLRPSVKKYLKYDLRLLKIFSVMYSFIDRQKIFDFKQIYKQFRTTSLQETHYLREAEVADYYYQSYKDHNYMVIPKTFKELSNDQVIVQEHISGISVAKLLTMQNNGIDARLYAKDVFNTDLFTMLEVIGIELLSKALVGDILQSDPHPGNIIVLANNKVALIDFGMTAQLNENRDGFYGMLVQYQAYYNSGSFSMGDMGLAALKYLSPKLYGAIEGADRYLDDYFMMDDERLIDKLKRVTQEVAYEHANKGIVDNMLEQNLIMRILFFVMNKDNRFGFSFDIKSISFLKASQGYLTLIGQFDVDCELVKSVINGAVEFGQLNMMKVIDSQDQTIELFESMEILSTWLDKMSRNDPWLATQLVGGL
ncbi:MAG TPA: AarF/ABC1/UbiB kinase family protein [Candidatus Saccharimonadales bacterium]